MPLLKGSTPRDEVPQLLLPFSLHGYSPVHLELKEVYHIPCASTHRRVMRTWKRWMTSQGSPCIRMTPFRT